MYYFAVQPEMVSGATKVKESEVLYEICTMVYHIGFSDSLAVVNRSIRT